MVIENIWTIEAKEGVETMEVVKTIEAIDPS